MSTRASSHLLVLAMVSAAMSACISHAANNWLPIEIDEEEMLDKIGDTGHRMMCKAFAGFVHRTYRSQLLVRAVCTAHALQMSSDAEDCADVTKDCLDTLPGPVDEQLDRILAQAGCAGPSVPKAGCKSPVSELISCFGDLGDAVGHIKLSATCAAFGSPLPPDWWRISPPSSCVDLFTRCDS